jgi:integrase/recombinase XerD
VQPYRIDEIRGFLSICEKKIKSGFLLLGLRNKAIILLFLDAALRLKELTEISLSDLDFKNGYVRIVGKGNSSGIAPFCAETANVIQAYLIERNKVSKTDRLWVTQQGHPLTTAGISSVFRQIKVKANLISPGRLHRIRHTAALSFLRATNNPFLLQHFLRHKDLAMSRRYVQGLQAEEAIEAHHRGASPVQNLKIL